MDLTTKMLRSQMKLLKPFMSSWGLDAARLGQDLVGRLMAAANINSVQISDCAPCGFPCSMIIPKKEIFGGIVL